MKTYIKSLFVIAMLAFFSTPLVADDVCDELFTATDGLYGLCNAFCVAQDCGSYAPGEEPNSCTKILANYNKKRTEDDPQMPCATACPCWGMAELTAGGSGLLNQGLCSTGSTQAVSWFEGGDTVNFFAIENPSTGATLCSYTNSLSEVNTGFIPTDEGQDAECRAGITALQTQFEDCD